jgi:cytosine/adenosine deaminase-related metal-dependent hydrolase
MARRLLIRGGTVVTLDANNAVARRRDLLVENGTIAAIGSHLDADAEVLDATDAVVMPGLVDAHRHLWYEPLRGMAMDASLPALHDTLWAKLAVRFTPGDVHVATRAAIAEALSCGITTVLDWCHVVNTSEHAQEAIRAHAELPIRSVFAYGSSMRGRIAGTETVTGYVAEVTRAFAGGRPVGTRMSYALALSGPETAPIAEVRREVAAARALGLPMSMHVGMRTGRRARRSVERIDRAGLLGADMQFVHCCETTERELGAIAAAGARIAVCPTAEMTLAMGAPPLRRARGAGVRPALATDAVCSASGDLFEEARVALGLERLQQTAPAGERPSPAACDVLAGITLDGARACWLEDQTGSLRVGKAADIVLLRGIPMADAVDPHAMIVAVAHSSNVDTVLVGGDVVKRDGHLVGIDQARAGAALIESRDRLLAEAGY